LYWQLLHDKNANIVTKFPRLSATQINTSKTVHLVTSTVALILQEAYTAWPKK